MAFEVPLPSVEPQVGATPTIHEELPAEATAAGVVGKGLDQLSQGVSKIADVFQQHAMQMAAIDNKTEADTAFGNNLQAANEYIGKWQQANTGMNAVTNLPQALRDLEAQRSQIGQNLSTPMAKVLYEQDSRRSLSYAESDLTRYANEERKKYILGQNAAVTNMVISDTVANPDHLQINQGKIQEQLATQASLVGWSKEELQDNYMKVNSGMLSDVIQSMADAGHGTQAQAFLDQHKGEMTGADQVRMSTYLKKTNEPGQIAGIVDGVVGRVAPNALGPGPTQPFSGTQPWHSGSEMIRANPQETISQMAGAPVTITSGARTPAENAAAHGSPTSEHLSGNAWDFVPKGISLEQAATNTANSLHEQGIPFDQIEVDTHNGHVHVGFGPKNRNEIIDQNGHSLSGGPRGLPSQTGDPLERLQTNLPQMLRDVDAAVDRQWPGEDNAARKDMAEQRLLAQVQRVKTAQDAQYSQSYDKLVTAASDPSVDSISALQHAYPGANSDFQALPAPMQRSLIRDLNQNANQVTDVKLDIRNRLDGEVANDPMGFAGKGPQYITDLDIPPSWKQHYIDTQQRIIGKAHNQAQMNQNINHALGLAPIAQGLKAAGIDKDSDDYNEFTGAMMGEIEHFENVHGRRPNDKDLMNIGAGLLAKKNDTYGIPFTGINWQSPGAVTFHVPDADKKLIIDRYQKSYGSAPNAATIAEIYWKTNAR